MNNSVYIAITESALDLLLLNDLIGEDNFPSVDENSGLFSSQLDKQIYGFYARNETAEPYVALIKVASLKELTATAGSYVQDIYRRIARVVKGLRNPPIHLPRQWSEYHHKNLLAFFALPKTASGCRWIAESDNQRRCLRFESITSTGEQVDLADFVPSKWPEKLDDALAKLANKNIRQEFNEAGKNFFAEEVDLQVIGSGSVVRNRTFEGWSEFLSEAQKKVLSQPVNSSVRIVGPAGSGKTLALCLRAVQIARDEEVSTKGKKVLVATHSWAMTERIDGIISVLNGGVPVNGITVFPLLSLLQMHAGNIGQQRVEIIGDDSTDGRVKSIDIIKKIISKDRPERKGISQWILDALSSGEDSRARIDLLFNLYEEISGVLTASGVTLDDQESVQGYLTGAREEWMPPFSSLGDRKFVIGIYKDFLRELVDRASITTDQFVIDSIRVLETFTWRMRKETEGYDFILVDELQLFDSQERSALELLGRSRKGVPVITAEDPSQGVFSALHSKRNLMNGLESVYLDTIHRFDKGIFELIKFIYQRFPLNTLPLRVDPLKGSDYELPKLHLCYRDDQAIDSAVNLAAQLFNRAAPGQDERICLATLGDVDSIIRERLVREGLSVVQLTSFDDVEQLTYSKRSLIVAPWQFIGGTQFSHVIVVAAAMPSAQSLFGKLRELTAVYLSCSRAANSLHIICGGYVPKIVQDAKEQALLSEIKC